MKKTTFQDRGFFAVLNNVVAGKITGMKSDTVTLFYEGGEQVYFHVGDNANDILQRIGREVSNMDHLAGKNDHGITQIPAERFDREW